jgi:hypothetical protein
MGATVARAIAAHGLPVPPCGFPSSPLKPEEWDALLAVVAAQRLTGYLDAAVADGALPVTDDQRDQVRERHLAACATVLRLERILLQLADHLEAAGIDYVVLKGTASAHLVHADPSVRMFGDNDLLFRTEDFERAMEVLGAVGYRRTTTPPTTTFARRFSKGATLRGPTGDELDAHRNLVFGTFGFLIDLDELFTSTVTFAVGGRQLRALGPETRLLHACYHAALGDPTPRLSSIRDVAQMLMTGDHDPDRTIDLVRAWEAQAVLARAIDLCREHLGVEVDGPVVATFRGYEPTRREHRAIDSYVGEDRSFAAKAIASLPYLDGFRDRLAFVRATLAPSPEFLESRGDHGRLAGFRDAVRSLQRGGRGR